MQIFELEEFPLRCNEIIFKAFQKFKNVHEESGRDDNNSKKKVFDRLFLYLPRNSNQPTNVKFNKEKKRGTVTTRLATIKRLKIHLKNKKRKKNESLVRDNEKD